MEGDLTDKDRTRLVEALGWKHLPLIAGIQMWRPPKGWRRHANDGRRTVYNYTSDLLPDPFTDANDDYAVLEWAIKNLDPDAYFSALTDVVGSYCYLHEYRIGYFALAALRVIDHAKTS